MILQERDRKILKLCYEQGFLTVEHVQQGFFKTARPREAYRRVQELEAAGFLVRNLVSMLGGRKLICPSPLGFDLASQESLFEVPQNRRIQLRTLDHDALVTSTRLRLMELWDGSWIPERHLKKTTSSESIPDGIVVFQSGFRVAIEVENSVKGRNRVLELIERRERSQDFDFTLYIASSPAVYRFLKKTIEKARFKPVFLVLWDDLRTGTPSAWSIDGCYSIFSRKEL